MTVIGNVGTLIIGALQAYLQFVPQTIPTVASSTVVAPYYFTTTSAADGSFSIVLEFGTYDVVVDGKKLFQIGVPDSSGTATIDTLIDGAVSFSPSLSNSGWIIATDVANLRLIPWSVALKMAFLTAPQPREPRQWQWNSGSTDTDDGLAIVKPFNITNLQQGRWNAW